MSRIRYEQPRVFADAPGVRSGFSMRHGGVSRGPYATLNLGLSTGDKREHVLKNRRLLFEAVDLPYDSLAVAGQVHGDRIKVVTEPGLFPGFDAMVTDRSHIPLCITAADCAVILLHQPDVHVIAAAHSGWRGTVARIVEETISIMERLGVQRDRLRAYVSPSICLDCFEVGEEVAAKFESGGSTADARGPALEDTNGPYVLRRPDWERPHVDLKSVIRDQLIRAGLQADAIEISARCTFGEMEDFYSYRGEAGITGRMMGFIALI